MDAMLLLDVVVHCSDGSWRDSFILYISTHFSISRFRFRHHSPLLQFIVFSSTYNQTIINKTGIAYYASVDVKHCKSAYFCRVGNDVTLLTSVGNNNVQTYKYNSD